LELTNPRLLLRNQRRGLRLIQTNQNKLNSLLIKM